MDKIDDLKLKLASAEARAVGAAAASILRLGVGTMSTWMLAWEVVFPDRAWDDAAEIELMVLLLSRGLLPL